MEQVGTGGNRKKKEEQEGKLGNRREQDGTGWNRREQEETGGNSW